MWEYSPETAMLWAAWNCGKFCVFYDNTACATFITIRSGGNSVSHRLKGDKGWIDEQLTRFLASKEAEQITSQMMAFAAMNNLDRAMELLSGMIKGFLDGAYD